MLLLPPFLFALPLLCRGQNMVCSAGFGSFVSDSTTGVAVSVGALKEIALARRACEAKLKWDKHEMLLVPDAWQVDVDLMNVDLGFGSPVAALQIKEAELDPLMTYEIYSLSKPPRKLRTITGGDSFRAEDTNLNGQIEIWTHDAAAVNGFEGMPVSAFDFPPAMALRFENRRLIDVSSEFPSRFDRQIATLRTQLDAHALSKFKNSDGKLSSLSHVSVDELTGVLNTKIRVLEIVWSYLYSGREQEAWHTLDDLWPATDSDRIRTAILDARARGIRKQVDGVSSLSAPARRRKQAMIYDSLSETTQKGVVNDTGGPDDKMKIFQIDTQAQAIFLRRPAPPADVPAASVNKAVLVDLVIDSAGKIWSIKTVGEPNKDIIAASAEWKFVPGLKSGRPVASRLRLEVAPFQ
jgi:hypothetical protein